MQRTVFIAILLSFFCSPHILSENAQKDKNKTITASFRVYDKLTKRPIPWALATITPLNDSISENDLVVRCIANDKLTEVDLELELPHKRAKYLISVYAEANSKVNIIIPGVTKYD